MTIGEYRVGITFNPGGNERVNEIKRRAADLIDYLESCREGAINESKRLIDLSQQDIETAAMHGVKAVTKGPMS